MRSHRSFSATGPSTLAPEENATLCPRPYATACALEIWAAPQNIGQVIGRQGRTIAAIRTLVHAAGTKARKHVIVEIVEKRSVSWYRSPA